MFYILRLVVLLPPLIQSNNRIKILSRIWSETSASAVTWFSSALAIRDNDRDIRKMWNNIIAMNNVSSTVLHEVIIKNILALRISFI